MVSSPVSTRRGRLRKASEDVSSTNPSSHNDLLTCHDCQVDFDISTLNVELSTHSDITKMTGLGVRWHCTECLNGGSSKKCGVENLQKQESAHDDLKSLFNDLQQRIAILEKAVSTQSNQANKGANPIIQKQVVKTPVVDITTHQVILTLKQDEILTMKSFSDIARKHLPDIPIKKIGITKEGHGYIKLPDKANCDDALNKLKANFSVTSQTRQQREFLPKVTVSGLDEQYNNDNKDDLKQAISSKNPLVKACIDNGQTFDVLFTIQDKSTKLMKAVIKVHPDILHVIKKLKYKLYVDCGVCRVSDRYFLNQCYRCQKFGHRNEGCPRKEKDEYVCRYCSGNHKSSTCSFLQSKNAAILKCPNCGGNHNSTDHSCTTLQNQLDFILRRTRGLENLSKNSIPRQAIVT